MNDDDEFGNIRKVVGVFDTLLGGAFGAGWTLVGLWVLVVFPAAIIYWAWPWIVATWDWLRELLTVF